MGRCTLGPRGFPTTARCPSVRKSADRRARSYVTACHERRGVAQLAEQRSPKPQVAGSSPVAPAQLNTRQVWTLEGDHTYTDERHAVSDDQPPLGPSAGEGPEDGQTSGAAAVPAGPLRPTGKRSRRTAAEPAGGAVAVAGDLGLTLRTTPDPRTSRPSARNRPRAAKSGEGPAQPVPVRLDLPEAGHRRTAQGHLAEPQADGHLHHGGAWCSWRSWSR